MVELFGVEMQMRDVSILQSLNNNKEVLNYIKQSQGSPVVKP